MRETAIQLIDKKYQELVDSIGASEKSPVEKLNAISSHISSVTEFSSEDKKRKFSWEEFSKFLNELAKASHTDLEIFKEMIKLSYCEEKLFLEMIQNSIFEDEKKIKAFLEFVIRKPGTFEGWGFGYSYLAKILDNNLPDGKKFHDVLVKTIGPCKDVPLKEDTQPQYSNFHTPVAIFLSTIGSDDVYSPFSQGSPVASPIAPSPKRSVRFVDDVTSQNTSPLPLTNQPISSKYEPLIEEGCEKIIARLQAYVAMRKNNPLRNVFHNKGLTEKKVKDAEALIAILEKKDVVAFSQGFELSLINNREWENAEHTYSFWKSSDGEYGKCLSDCREILKSVVLNEYKKNLITKIKKLDVSDKVTTAITIVDDGLSILEIQTKLRATCGLLVCDKLKSAFSDAGSRTCQSLDTSSRSPGALKIDD